MRARVADRCQTPAARKGGSRLALSVCALVAVACAGDAPERLPGDGGDSPDRASDSGPAPAREAVEIGDSAVGCLAIGAPLEAVRAGCGAVRDTVIHLEGSPQRAVWVEVGSGVGPALAEVVDGKVWRIRIEDPGLRTADSIGVGSPVRRLAGLPGARIARGEGTFALTDAHCGLSFEVHGLPLRFGWTAEELAGLPDSVRVARILVVGRCDHGRGGS